MFNCFGCGKGGSNFDWVQETQGVGFRHAYEILKERDFSSLAANSTAVKNSRIPKLHSPLSANANDQTVLRETIDYYHEAPKQSPEALDYLNKRGLNDSELIDAFNIGYANRTLGLRLPAKSCVNR